MRQLGGETIMLTGTEMQLGRGETIADTARVLSRYVDAIMIRILDHARAARTGEPRHRAGDQRADRHSHPCQIMADMMTFEEHRGPIAGRTVAWTGDGNNVLASWLQPPARFDFRLDVASPPGARRSRPTDAPGRGDSGAAIALMTRSRRGGRGRRLRRHRHLGVDGRRGRASVATTCCSPTRSTRG